MGRKRTAYHIWAKCSLLSGELKVIVTAYTKTTFSLGGQSQLFLFVRSIPI